MNSYKYPQKLLKKLSSESGVTLTILVITIVVLLIIASIVLVNSNAGSEQRALNNMYNDIRALDGKIAVYYEKNKELPVLYDESGKAKVALYFEKYDELKPEYDKSTDKTVIKQQLHDTERNINDNEVYYVIDTSKLDNINLSYAERENEEEYTYVINEKSHTIYYLPGVALKDATYYKLPIEYEDIIVNQKYTVKYVVNGSVVQKTGNLNYGDKTPSAPEVTDIEEGYAFVGWMPESDKTIVLKSEEIEEILVEHDETYTAQIKDKNQAITYELFGGENNENNTEGYRIGERKEILNPTYVQKGRNFENEEDISGIDYTLNEENLEKCDEYIFTGWYLDKDYKKELPKDNEGNYYIPEEGIYPNTILYAKWSAPAAKVIYNEMQPVYEFNYTGDVQEFIVPADGTYKIEAWGAAGGYSLNNNQKGIQGGNGGYTSGKIELKRGETLYIYVGNKGEDGTYKKDAEAGFNGGGLGTWDNSDDEAAGAGGGATDIRLVSGEWNDFESLKSRIMVAGGGGGTSWNTKGGSAGGLTGYIANKNTIAGSQTGGYKFGIGQDGYGTGDSDGVAGAGGGYYGGTASDSNYSGVYESAAGGSSFISGHEGCDAIDELSTEDNIIHTSQNIHYSGRKFTDTEMRDGKDSNMPSQDGEGTITGNSGNGYVKITSIEVDQIGDKYCKTLEEAIEACEDNGNIQTKIVMLKDVEENNGIANGKNIILDLSGHIISSNKKASVLEIDNSKLQIIGKGEIKNSYKYEFSGETENHGEIDGGIGIYLTNNAELTMGIDDRKVNRDIKIFGYGAGTYKDKLTESVINFYDGEVSGIKAIIGNVDKTARNCNVVTDLNETTNILTAYLGVIENPIAKIGNVYYGNLESAINDVPESTEYETKTIDTRLIPENFVGDDQYFFYKDEELNALIPNNSENTYTVAHSYIKIDLTDLLDEDYILTVNASSSCHTWSQGYALVTESETLTNIMPSQINSQDKFMLLSGIKDSTDYNKTLRGGKIYYLHLCYYRNNHYNYKAGDERIVINSIKLNNSETLEVPKKSTIKYLEPTTIVMLPEDEEKPEISRNIRVTIEQEIPFNKNVVLDLNGQTTTVPILKNRGSLEIIDSNENKKGMLTSTSPVTLENNNKLKISSGTINIGIAGTSNSNTRAIVNLSNLTIDGGSITSEYNYADSIRNLGKLVINDVLITGNSHWDGIENAENGECEINGGKIQSNGSNSYCINNIDNSKLTINNMEIINNAELGIYNNSSEPCIINCVSVTGNGGYYSIQNNKQSIIKIYDCELRNKSIYNYGGKIYFENGIIESQNKGSSIENRSGGELYINGGTLKGVIYNYDSLIELNGGLIESFSVGKDTGISNSGNNCKIIVNGGKIKDFNEAIRVTNRATVDINNIEEIVNCNYGLYLIRDSYYGYSGVANIGQKDESINNKPVIAGNLYGIYEELGGTINFYDGIIKGKNRVFGSFDDIEKGTEIKLTYEDEIYTEELIVPIEPIAKIVETEKTYLQLQDAIDEAEELQTIQILRDANIAMTVNVDETKKIKIDFNGHKIEGYNLLFNNKGMLEIDNTDFNKEASLTVKNKAIRNLGELSIKNILIENVANGYKYDLIYNDTEKSLTLDNVKIKLCLSGVKGIYNNNGKVELKDINVDADFLEASNGGTYIIENVGENSNLIINNSNMKMNKGEYMIKTSGGEITINDGNYVFNNVTYNNGIIYSNNTTLKISRWNIYI